MPRSSDPFALRRAANGIVNITWNSELEIDLLNLITQFVTSFLANHDNKDSPQQALEEFFMQRIRTLLLEEKNLDYDLVNAVLGNQDTEYTQRALSNLLDVRDRALFLQSIRLDFHHDPQIRHPSSQNLLRHKMLCSNHRDT